MFYVDPALYNVTSFIPPGSMVSVDADVYNVTSQLLPRGMVCVALTLYNLPSLFHRTTFTSMYGLCNLKHVR